MIFAQKETPKLVVVYDMVKATYSNDKNKKRESHSFEIPSFLCLLIKHYSRRCFYFFDLATNIWFFLLRRT